MKREAVRTFLKAGADVLNMHFDAGRITEFNKVPDKGFPFAWVEELRAASSFGGSGAMLIDHWSVKIHIAKKDSIDSNHDQYENIVDECDQLARQLIWQYNVILFSSTVISTANQDLYKLVTLSDVNREPFYKKHSNPATTGIILSFNLNTPDKTDVCP